jgi:hypothetical protein
VQTAIAQTRAVEDAVATSVRGTLQATQGVPQPTATAAPVAQATATAPSPADTPTPAVAATPLPTAAPPTATRVRVQIAESQVDGDDGNDFLRGSSVTNQGRVILLPGFDQSEITSPPVFRDRLVFRVEVFDTRVGLYDGAGIQQVDFHIEPDDGSGQIVYERTERNAGYCVFGGGEPDCNVLALESGSRWPDPFGGEIVNGYYLAVIDIIAENGEQTQWRWRFEVAIPGVPSTGSPMPHTARINSIAVQDGRYVVDFETFGFDPLRPGQHVHFFFNTVPPEQAGYPGSGPWQLYPEAPGQPNTSPFTLYTVADRPAGATQICILVANDDHSVIQHTGNCVDLP